MTHPFRRNRFFRNALPEANISELGNIRSLHLGTPTIQSSMNVDNPVELVLSYSRAMMPDCRQTAVEINPQVIQIARASFCLDFEGDAFQIIEADGAEYIQILRGNTDVVLVDGFDGVQIIDELVAEPFFHDCRMALSEKGIFTANWWSGDKRYPLFLQRLRTIFDNRVLEVPATTHGNVAVLAFCSEPELNIEKLKKRADKLGKRYGLDFFRMLMDAKGRNLHNQKQFLWRKGQGA